MQLKGEIALLAEFSMGDFCTSPFSFFSSIDPTRFEKKAPYIVFPPKKSRFLKSEIAGHYLSLDARFRKAIRKAGFPDENVWPMKIGETLSTKYYCQRSREF